MSILSQPFDNRSSRGFFYVHFVPYTISSTLCWSFYAFLVSTTFETGKNNKRFTVKTRDYIGRKRTTTGYGPTSTYTYRRAVVHDYIQCVACTYIIQSDFPTVITPLPTWPLLGNAFIKILIFVIFYYTPLNTIYLLILGYFTSIPFKECPVEMDSWHGISILK